MNKNKLAIFDLDGTLYDTKGVNYRAYKEALSQIGYNVNIDFNYYSNYCNANSFKVFLPTIVEGITIEEMNRVHEIKKNVYSHYLNFAVRNDLLFNIIDLIKSEFIIALVTGANYRNAIELLETFSDVEKVDLIITQEDVKNVKPSPECFIYAMDKVKINTENTLIFEDSDAGIEAAKLSGAKYVKVYGYNWNNCKLFVSHISSNGFL